MGRLIRWLLLALALPMLAGCGDGVEEGQTNPKTGLTKRQGSGTTMKGDYVTVTVWVKECQGECCKGGR